jgi:hypothetical protein
MLEGESVVTPAEMFHVLIDTRVYPVEAHCPLGAVFQAMRERNTPLGEEVHASCLRLSSRRRTRHIVTKVRKQWYGQDAPRECFLVGTHDNYETYIA